MRLSRLLLLASWLLGFLYGMLTGAALIADDRSGVVHNRIYTSQVKHLLDNVTANNRHKDPEAAVYTERCHLHVFNNQTKEQWLTEIKRGRELGYTVAPSWRLGWGGTTVADWYSKDWWDQRAVDVAEAIIRTGCKEISYDHENYGSAGQLHGTPEQLQLMKEAAVNWLNVVDQYDLKVHIHPATVDYIFCQMVYGNGIEGTAQHYNFGLQSSFWQAKNNHINAMAHRDADVARMLRLWPQVYVAETNFDVILRTPWNRRLEQFTNVDNIGHVDDEFKADYHLMGTEEFESGKAYGLEGLKHVYQTRGARDHEWIKRQPNWAASFVDRLASFDTPTQEATYLVHSWPSNYRWVHGQGTQPNGNPQQFVPNYCPPIDHVLQFKAKNNDASIGMQLLLGSWVGVPPAYDTRFSVFAVYYDHNNAILSGSVVNTANQIFTVSIPDISFSGGDLERISLFIDAPVDGRGIFKLKAGSLSAVGVYIGELHNQTHATGGDSNVDVIEYEVWGRESPHLDLFPHMLNIPVELN